MTKPNEKVPRYILAGFFGYLVFIIWVYSPEVVELLAHLLRGASLVKG